MGNDSKTPAFLAEVDATTSGARTKQTARECLLSALKPINVELPMMKFDRQLMELLVKTNVELIQQEKRSGRTAKNYCMAVKRLIKWYSKKVDEYRLPKDFDDIFSVEHFRPPADDNDNFTEEGEEKDFEVYTTSDIKTVFECCNDDEERLVVLMALNAGCYFVDIAHTIKAKNVYLDRKPPFLLYKRQKEKRFTPLIQKAYLWDETAEIVRRLLNRGNNYSYAFLTAEGQPHNMKSIRRIWRRVYKKAIKRLTHRQSVKFIDLRKTGGSAISNCSSIDLGELFLGHRIPTMGKLYIKLAKTRLKTPTYKWYRQLKDAGVFESFPKLTA